MGKLKDEIEMFQYYVDAVRRNGSEQKQAVLLHLTFPAGQGICDTLSDPGNDFESGLCYCKFKHFMPKKNLIYEGYIF